MSELVPVDFHGGPADGSRVPMRAPSCCCVMLVTWRNEIHGYHWNAEQGEMVHGLLLASAPLGVRAADVLRKHGREHVELQEEGGAI